MARLLFERVGSNFHGGSKSRTKKMLDLRCFRHLRSSRTLVFYRLTTSTSILSFTSCGVSRRQSSSSRIFCMKVSLSAFRANLCLHIFDYIQPAVKPVLPFHFLFCCLPPTEFTNHTSSLKNSNGSKLICQKCRLR